VRYENGATYFQYNGFGELTASHQQYGSAFDACALR